MSEVIVLDTHVWVWWAGSPQQLSDQAHDIIRKAIESNTLFISSISVWEVAMLVAKDRLELSMDVKEWVAASEALPYISFVPVSNHIAIKAVRLPIPLHSDPADRIIIATALSLGGALMTADKKILGYPHVKTVLAQRAYS